MNKNLKILIGLGVLAALAGGVYVYYQGSKVPDDAFVGNVDFLSEQPAQPTGIPVAVKTSDLTPLSLDASDMAEKPPVGDPTLVPDNAETLSAPEQPKQSFDISKELEPLKQQVEALTVVVQNQGKALDKLSAAYVSLRNETEQTLQQASAKKVDNLGQLIQLTPMETEYAMHILPNLPKTVVPNKYNVTAEQCHAVIQNGNIDSLIQSFLLLSAQGERIYMCVGNPDPRNRPVWLEQHNQNSITLIAKNLPFDAYKNIQSRAALPRLFQVPAYLVTYQDGELKLYRACDDFKLQTY